MIKYKIKRHRYADGYTYSIDIKMYNENDEEFNIFKSTNYNIAHYNLEDIRGCEDTFASDVIKYNNKQYKPIGDTHMMAIVCTDKFEIMELEKIAESIRDKLDSVISQYDEFQKVHKLYTKEEEY